ncbi:MAG: response regulator transcription factor [Chloroflexi bacterium]|nr:response regulator transcription factor [Chloroflexota bacterium]MBP7041948.1 response regulator transcription factor [Chloroflexota bacterium]
MPESSTILIVDDEQNLRETLAVILRDEGYQVYSAAAPSEALTYLRQRAFDIMFLDIRMPEKSGLDLLPEIRQLHPRMPILILTAYASLDSAIEAMRKGANDYLFKPINPIDILHRVNIFLSKRPNSSQDIVQEMKSLLAQLEGSNDSLAVSTGGKEAQAANQRFLHCGKITVDLIARQIFSDGQIVNVTPTSFDYMLALMRHAPETIGYVALVEEAQGYDLTQIEANDLARGRIHELRKALEEDPRRPSIIITIRGVGYRLVC